MDNDQKIEPTLSPSQQIPLEDNLRMAITDADKAQGLKVSLTISGGAPGQRYHFRYIAIGNGEIDSEMRCELTKRVSDGKRGKQSREQFVGLLDRIYKSGLLKQPAEPPGFLPDTIVGRLEITDGDQTYQTYFAADPEQAKVQGRPVSKPLESVVNAIYQLASEATGLKSVRP